MELGQWQLAKIIRMTSVGAYVNDDPDTYDDILLPLKQVPAEAKVGDQVNVFLYRDSDDRLITTTYPVKITRDHCAVLEVIEVAKVGAFLSWGLNKDLLCPFSEQTYPLKPKDQVLVALYVDQSQRLCATMKVHPFLKDHPPYVVDEHIEVIPYQANPKIGIFCALDLEYRVLLPKRETFEGKLQTPFEVRIARIHDDGKVEVSQREKGHLEINEDAENVYQLLLEHPEYRELTDKSAPEAIYEVFHLSKAAYKRALGHLYKEKRIVITKEAIEFVQED